MGWLWTFLLRQPLSNVDLSFRGGIGDSVEWHGWRFTVTRATARRAERMEVEKLPHAEEPRTGSKRPRSVPADG